MVGSGACQNSSLTAQERRNEMRRKRFQRGSLKPRKRNGKTHWYAQWREYGEPRSKELGLYSSLSRAEAETMLAAILQPINEGVGKPQLPVFTFKAFIDSVYLPVYSGKWKASTAMNEELRIQVHLVGTLGAQLMTKIDRDVLQGLLNEKAKVLARGGVNHLRFRLRSIFTLAVSEGVVERNPAVSLFTPRRCKQSREKLVLTPEDINRIMSALDLRERLVVRLATFEGMQPGEILALQIGDIDDQSVWVRRRVYKGNLDVPKTRRSLRRVALSAATVELLADWVDQAPDQRPEAWLFPAVTLDAPIRRDNIWRRCMLSKLEKIGLEWATFQVMRRTFATLSKKAGVDAHTRSAQMGNTVDVNENEYAVSTFEDRLAAVRKVEATVIQ
jgi:integrase